MSERNLDAKWSAVEATLAGLVPAESSLARDRVMYLAGMAAARAEQSAGRSVNTESVGRSVSTETQPRISPLVLTEHPTNTRCLRLWQTTTAVMSLLACGLGAALAAAMATRPEPQVVIQRVAVPVETPRVDDGMAGVEPQASDDAELDAEAAARRMEQTVAYRRTWRALATGGLDALPSPQPQAADAPAPRQPETLRGLIDELQQGKG